MAEGRYVISRIGRTLIFTLEGAVEAGTLSAASQVLAEMQARHSADSVVFEVSGCEMIDLDEFMELQRVVHTMEWLGLRCVDRRTETWSRCLSCHGWHYGRIASHLARPRARIAGAQS